MELYVPIYWHLPPFFFKHLTYFSEDLIGSPIIGGNMQHQMQNQQPPEGRPIIGSGGGNGNDLARMLSYTGRSSSPSSSDSSGVSSEGSDTTLVDLMVYALIIVAVQQPQL